MNWKDLGSKAQVLSPFLSPHPPPKVNGKAYGTDCYSKPPHYQVENSPLDEVFFVDGCVERQR